MVEGEYGRVMLMWTAKYLQMLHKREQRAVAHVVGHPRTACTPKWFTINSPQLPSLCALTLASPVASWRTLSHLGEAPFSPSSHTTLTSGTFESPLSIVHHRTLSAPAVPTFIQNLSVVHGARRQLAAWLVCDSLISCVRSCKKNGLKKNSIWSCNKLHNRSDMTAVLQRSKRKVGEIHLHRLIYVTVLWICTQPHANWNNRRMFIFTGH